MHTNVFYDHDDSTQIIPWQKSSSRRGQKVRAPVNRNNEGCLICRVRRKKCDSSGPDQSCKTCQKYNIECWRATIRPDWMQNKDKLAKLREDLKAWVGDSRNRLPGVPILRTINGRYHEDPTLRTLDRYHPSKNESFQPPPDHCWNRWQGGEMVNDHSPSDAPLIPVTTNTHANEACSQRGQSYTSSAMAKFTVPREIPMLEHSPSLFVASYTPPPGECSGRVGPMPADNTLGVHPHQNMYASVPLPSWAHATASLDTRTCNLFPFVHAPTPSDR